MLGGGGRWATAVERVSAGGVGGEGVGIDCLYLRKAREGCNCLFHKAPRSKGGDKAHGSVEETAGVHLLVPEVLELKACRDPENSWITLFQMHCTGTFAKPCEF